MTETITLDGKNITYQLEYRDNKNTYLKFEHGKIIVIASKYHSKEIIEDLLQRYQDKILSYLSSYSSPYLLEDGGYIDIFNKRYPIVLDDHDFEAYRFIDNQFVVYHSNIEKITYLMMERTLRRYLDKRINEYLKYSFMLPKPEIVIKKVKRRWGACYPRKNKVSFNISLVHLDKELIDYVIVHELCHFMEPNHSHAFYRQVAKRMPDYKIRKRKLRDIHL